MKNLIKTFALILFLTDVCSAGTMSLTRFQYLVTVNEGRCNNPMGTQECREELDYAKQKGLIDESTAQWGKSNGYYPVVTRSDEIGAVCPCGCFESNTLISTANEGEVAIKNLTKDHRVVALGENATLDNIELTEKSIKRSTQGKESIELYVFELSNGSVLKLTQHHGVLLASGLMTTAKEVALTDKMITQKGVEVDIVSISRELTDEDVYNFETDSTNKQNHIIVAEGILVGDLIWQNQYAQDLNSILLR